MHRFLGLLVLAAALAPGARAQDIQKCVSDENVVAYQDAPCQAGSIDAGILRLPEYADPPQRDAASAPGAEPAAPGTTSDDTSPTGGNVASADTQAPARPISATVRAFPFRRTIALGMTDDQVLNLPDWGRPTHIARTRARLGFRERWTYEATDGARELSFVNGRLAGMDRSPAAPERIAGLSATR
jgi:hypothetical protein